MKKLLLSLLLLGVMQPVKAMNEIAYAGDLLGKFEGLYTAFCEKEHSEMSKESFKRSMIAASPIFLKQGVDILFRNVRSHLISSNEFPVTPIEDALRASMSTGISTACAWWLTMAGFRKTVMKLENTDKADNIKFIAWITFAMVCKDFMKFMHAVKETKSYFKSVYDIKTCNPVTEGDRCYICLTDARDLGKKTRRATCCGAVICTDDVSKIQKCGMCNQLITSVVQPAVLETKSTSMSDLLTSEQLM